MGPSGAGKLRDQGFSGMEDQPCSIKPSVGEGGLPCIGLRHRVLGHQPILLACWEAETSAKQETSLKAWIRKVDRLVEVGFRELTKSSLADTEESRTRLSVWGCLGLSEHSGPVLRRWMFRGESGLHWRLLGASPDWLGVLKYRPGPALRKRDKLRGGLPRTRAGGCMSRHGAGSPNR